MKSHGTDFMEIVGDMMILAMFAYPVQITEAQDPGFHRLR